MKSRLLTLLRLSALVLGLATAVVRGERFEVLYSDNLGPHPNSGLLQGSNGSFYGTTYDGGASFGGTVFKMTPEGVVKTLVSFVGVNGRYPSGGLVAGSDGSFYGTTQGGGASDCGTVFKVTAEGVLTTMVTFARANGASPDGGLIQGNDGNFYGTTVEGGSKDYGTVYKMSVEGELTTLVSFTRRNGSYPSGGLVQASDGSFYGTTGEGGSRGLGTVFKMTPAGLLKTLVPFTGANGSSPHSRLFRGSDGKFYGTTTEGGAKGLGTAFRMSSGGVLETLVSFDGENGESPNGQLIQGSDGNFYGTTCSDGGNHGTVFKLTAQGLFRTLVYFYYGNGSSPGGPLVQGSDGNFYGTTTKGGTDDAGTAYKLTLEGALTTLTDFRVTRGVVLDQGLVQGSDGNFYGTSSSGGSIRNGIVFKVTVGGGLTTLVRFTGSTGLRGYDPVGMLVQGSDGSFYGANQRGGSSDCGTLFKVTAEGTLTTLVNFTGANGRQPSGGLVLGSDGSFYGVTTLGGTSNGGTVFRMTAEGVLTTLASFAGDDGNYPYGKLVQASDGNFYGTTAGGPNKKGTCFRITPGGVLTMLASHGQRLLGGLAQASDGNFYGIDIDVTNGGAGNTINWSVFQMTPQGAVKALESILIDHDTDFVSDLVRVNDGDLYGVAKYGGSEGYGAVFKVTTKGVLTVVYSFDGSSAAFPNSTPMIGHDGNLYGTASQSAVWRLLLPGAPAVTTTAATQVTSSGVTLHGTVSSHEVVTAVTFEVSTSADLGSGVTTTSPAQTLPSTATGVAVSKALSGLAAKTTYYYRAVGGNSAGTTRGETMSFTTGDPAQVAPNGATSGTTGDPQTVTIAFPAMPSMTITGATAVSGLRVDSFTAKTVTFTPLATFVGNGSFTYAASTDSGGTATGSVTVAIADNDPPVVTHVPARWEIAAGPDGTAVIGDRRGEVTFSDAVSTPTISQTPDAATVLGLGSHPVVFEARDAAGNATTVLGEVVVAFGRPGHPETTSSGRAGRVVRGFPTGDLAPLPPEATLSIGASMGEFSAPALSDVRSMTAQATIVDGRKEYRAIYTVDGEGAAFIPAYETGPAPGADGFALGEVSYKSFLHPVIAPGGAIAFIAKLQGAGAKGAADGVWSDVFTSAGDLRLVLREGLELPGFAHGEKLKSVSSVSLRDGQLLASVTLASLKDVVSARNAAALVLLTAPSTGIVLLQEGTELATVPGSTIERFSVLQPALGSPGQGRWHGEWTALAKVTLSSGEVQLVKIAPDTVTKLLSTADAPALAIAGFDADARWKSFSLPAMSGDGLKFTVQATLAPKDGAPTAQGDAVLLFSADGVAWSVYAREGGLMPAYGPHYASFFDPIANDAGQVAFLTTLGGTDVTPKDKTALVCGAIDRLGVVARAGYAARDETGRATSATWSKFLNFASPSGDRSDLVFIAEVAGGDTTPKNKLGLWTADSTGTVRRLLRTGVAMELNGPVLTSFSLLSALPGAFGAARSYNETGSVAVLETFADKTQALVRVDIP